MVNGNPDMSAVWLYSQLELFVLFEHSAWDLKGVKGSSNWGEFIRKPERSCF